MKYTIFIYSVLLVMVFTKMSHANEASYSLDSCNNGLNSKNPISTYVGDRVVIRSEQMVELIPASGFHFILSSAQVKQHTNIDAILSYTSKALAENFYIVQMREQSLRVNKDFERSIDIEHVMQIAVNTEDVKIEWTESDGEWDEYFSCTYKTDSDLVVVNN